MPNKNGSVYGLTILSPIIDDESAIPSHDLQIREYLATLPTGEESPFALAPGTHLARLVVMDDVIYVGMPACEEHLHSKYLVFESNCDGDLDNYLRGLAATVPEHLDAIWSHCVGYPGAANPQAFIDYMKACQLETTFFFAAVNDKSVPETLSCTADATRGRRLHCVPSGHGAGATAERVHRVRGRIESRTSSPGPGGMAPRRDIKTGGRNE